MMRSLLSGIALAGLTVLSPQWGMGPGPGTPQAPAAPCNAVSAWPMNEGSGLTLNDASTGGTNTATINTGASVVWTANSIKTGATSPVWQGTGRAAATSTTLTNFTGTTPFSVSAWIKPITNSGALISTLSGASTTGWALELVGTNVEFFIINTFPGNRLDIVSPAPTTGALHYITATYDGSRNAATGAIIYIDGSTVGGGSVVANTLSASAANGVAPSFGSRPGGTTQEYNGAMAYVEVYNCVLTPTQIAANFAGGPGIY